MDKQLKILALALALAAGTSAQAADNSDIEALRSRIASGETQAAWQQAQQMRASHESDTEFDFLYGLLALDNNQYNEAQFALERVTLAEPTNARARLALAKTYFKLGDQHSARRQFEAVKQSNPPAHIMRDVNHYMAEMDGGHGGSLTGYVEAGLGHDNNVNSATGNGIIANPLFDPLDATSNPALLLDRNASQQSDMYDLLQGGLDYYRPLDSNTGIEAKGRIAKRDNFSSDRYDTMQYRGSVGVVQVFGKNQLRATLTAQDFRLSDSDFQELYGVSADWTHYNYGGWTVSGAVYFNELRYSEDSLRNVYQYLGNLAVQRQLGRMTHTLGLMLGDEDAQRAAGDHNAREFAGVYYDAGYELSGGHQLFGRAYWQDSHQDGEDPFFRQTRDDQFHQLSFGWNWHINKPLRLRTELVYSDNDSDVDYYSYDRTRLQTALRYSF